MPTDSEGLAELGDVVVRRDLARIDPQHGLPATLTSGASLAASFSSVAASHCSRLPASCQTARQRPRSSRAGYPVMPCSSSMTSPPPRVAARPASLARTWPRTDRSAAPRGACGDFVGILTTAGGACVIGLSLFLRCRR
jgi:hypothetical protein